MTGAPPAGAGARAELGLEDDFYSTSAGQRERALASTDRLNKTGDRIQNGRQQLLETEVRHRVEGFRAWTPPRWCTSTSDRQAVAIYLATGDLVPGKKWQTRVSIRLLLCAREERASYWR